MSMKQTPGPKAVYGQAFGSNWCGRRNMEGEENENKWDGDSIQLVHIYIAFQSFLIVLRQANIWAKQSPSFPQEYT